MIERVARAIYERHAANQMHFDESYVEWAAVVGKDGWSAVARAAIEAMMEPTEAMLEAAGRVVDPTAWRQRPATAGPYFEKNRAQDQAKAKHIAGGAIKAALRATPSKPHGPGENS